VALTTHSQLVLRLKKEYSYTYNPHPALWGGLYYLSVQHSYKMTKHSHTNHMCGSCTILHCIPHPFTIKDHRIKINFNSKTTHLYLVPRLRRHCALPPHSYISQILCLSRGKTLNLCNKTNKCTHIKDASSHIINYQHVLVVFVITII